MPTATSDQRSLDHQWMAQAARLALRGHGGTEPNPMVGCVIVADDGRVVGQGYHRHCGAAHAERLALEQAGRFARASTVYVTLEPCDHTGRTGPCSEALIDARVARVVIARRDPNPVAAGGAARLRAAGIRVDFLDEAEPVIAVTDPFVHRIRTGLPWVVAKWAQTIDGRIATATGDSKWISGPASRRLVHRQRGRVDGILTAIGTVKTDDPLLTARDVRVRRRARRIVVDPSLELPLDSRLVGSVDVAPLTVICRAQAAAQVADHRAALESRGVEVIAMPVDSPTSDLPLAASLRELVRRHDMTTVLVEAGPGLLSRLLRDGLVNMAWVFTAPRLFGDERAVPAVRGWSAELVDGGVPLTLRWLRRRDDDVIGVYTVRR